MRTTATRDFRFSSRTAWNREELSLAATPRQASYQDRPTLDLTVSNPTRCGLDFDLRTLLAPLADAGSLVYEPDPLGLPVAREAVSGYYARHDVRMDPGQIVLSASTSEAYSHLFRLLCDVGDEVLVAQPSYPLFDYLAELSDVVIRPFPLFYDHGWWIDFAELESRVTSQTRALIVVHPNNPTGHATSTAERSLLRQFAARHRLALVVDEVFLDYSHEPGAELASFGAEPAAELTFLLSGLSKAAALPQMKLGWIAVLGPEAVRREALGRLEIIADTFLSVNTPAQLACPSWLRASPAIQQTILLRIRENLAGIHRSGIQMFDLEAGWSAVLKLSRTYDEPDAATALMARGVVTHPGWLYGMPDPSVIVVSLLTPAAEFSEALERMA